jgi:GWxTD domain-containing protein
MKPQLQFILVCAILSAMAMSGCSSSSEAVSDCFATRQYKKLALPTFSSYIMNVASGDSGRIDVYYNLPYQHLHFEKTDGGFFASYTFSIILRNENGDIVQSKDVQRSVTARTYDESVSSRSDAFLLTVPAPPGTYMLEMIAVDNGSGLQYRERKKITARKFHTASIASSDFLLLESASAGKNGISLRPAFPSSLALLKDSLGIFQEVYNVHAGDSLRVSFSYRVSKITPPRPYYYSAPTALGYFRQFSPCGQKFDSVAYQNDSVIIAPSNATLQLIQFFPKPPRRYVDIVQTVVRTRNGISDSTVNSLKVLVTTPSFPDVTSPAELAEAMLFLARGSETDSLLNAHTDSMRIAIIADFWKEHGTEKMQLFQQRLRDANELFTACMEGWKTPMGIVYLVCGPPEYVDCQASLYETWYYTAGNTTLSISFRMVPQSDDTEPVYYEIVPYSINDYAWQYFVDRWR